MQSSNHVIWYTSCLNSRTEQPILDNIRIDLNPTSVLKYHFILETNKPWAQLKQICNETANDMVEFTWYWIMHDGIELVNYQHLVIYKLKCVMLAQVSQLNDAE